MQMHFTSIVRATACAAVRPRRIESRAQPIRHCANAGANQHSAATFSTDRQPVRAALGLTLLSDGTVAKLKDRLIELERPFVSQFGWQFEKQFFTRDSGVTMVTEWVGSSAAWIKVSCCQA